MKKIVLISSLMIIVGMSIFSPVNADELTTQGDGSSFSVDVCANGSMKDLTGLVNWASCFLVKAIVPFLFALATVAFIWGVIQYYLNPDNEEKRKKGKSFIIGGLIALFVMITMWGLVGILANTFGVKNVIPTLPQ